jgi:O-antigen ligase
MRQTLKSLRLEQVFLLLMLLAFPFDMLLPLSEKSPGAPASEEGLTFNKLFAAATLATFAVRAVIEKNPDLLRNLVSTPTAVWFLAFFGTAVLSLVQARDAKAVIRGDFHWATVFGLYYMLVSMVRTRGMLKLCILMFVLGGAVNALGGAYEMFTNESLVAGEDELKVGAHSTVTGSTRLHGVSSDCDSHAATLLMVLALALYCLFAVRSHAVKAVGVGFLMLICLNLIGSGSRAAWMGMFIILGFFFWLVPLPKKQVYVLFGIFAVASCFLVLIVAFPDIAVLERMHTPDSQGGTGSASILFRIEMIRMCWQMGWDHPLFGVGSLNFLAAYQHYWRVSDFLSKADPKVPHNIFFQVFAETGVLGAVFYLCMTASIVWEGVMALRRARDKDAQLLALGVLTSVIAYLYCQNVYPVQSFKHGWALFGFSSALAQILRAEQQPLGDQLNLAEWQEESPTLTPAPVLLAVAE